MTVALALGGCGGSDDAGDWGGTTLEPVPVLDVADTCAVPTVSQLNIQTAANQPIVDRHHDVPAVVEFSGAAQAQDNGVSDARIRGRGNSTWDYMPKKSYKLKLAQKTGHFAMPHGKKRAMLANYADKSMLRTELAFCLAEILQLPYTPKSHFVEVTLNTDPVGLYQMTNKTYEVSDRIEAEKAENRQQASEPDDNALFDEAFLLEIDARLLFEGTLKEWFQTESGISWKFRSKTDPQQARRVARWFDELEAVINNT